jgi:hypothetical protein
MKLPSFAAIATAALVLLLAWCPPAVKADNYPPLYAKSGTLATSGSVTFQGFGGQGTCAITLATPLYTGVTATISWGSAGIISPAALFTQAGVPDNTAGILTMTGPFLTRFFNCANIQTGSLVVTATNGVNYTLVATTQAWPWGNAGGAALASPAPAGAPACGYNDLGLVGCMVADKTTMINSSTIGSAVLISAVAGQKIYILGYNVSLASGVSFEFQGGPAGSCGSPAAIGMGPISGLGGTSAIVNMPPQGAVLYQSGAGSAICLTLAGTSGVVGGSVYYTQF